MNKITEMFDMDKIKEMIDNCPPDQVVIICAHWSINQPKYTEEELLNENFEHDWNEFENQIGHSIQISQYDDLVIDVHGIMEM